MNDQEVDRHVNLAAQAYLSLSSYTADAWHEAMVSNGLPERSACQIFLLLPVALGRAYLQQFGQKFLDRFVLLSDDGRPAAQGSWVKNPIGWAVSVLLGNPTWWPTFRWTRTEGLPGCLARARSFACSSTARHPSAINRSSLHSHPCSRTH